MKPYIYYRRFLSTPSARRATVFVQQRCRILFISIHTLREEGDLTAGDILLRVGVISIHALREEGDLDGLAQLVPDGLFLSTSSARRATVALLVPPIFS